MRKIKYFIPFVIVFLFIATSQSCYYDVESELYPTTGTTSCDTSSAQFASFVSPLIASKCATSGCHNSTTASAGVNLDGYTAIKNYISKSQSTFFGSINQTSGYSAMPKGGTKFSTCEITKLQVWVNAGMLNN